MNIKELDEYYRNRRIKITLIYQMMMMMMMIVIEGR